MNRYDDKLLIHNWLNFFLAHTLYEPSIPQEIPRLKKLIFIFYKKRNKILQTISIFNWTNRKVLKEIAFFCIFFYFKDFCNNAKHLLVNHKLFLQLKFFYCMFKSDFSMTSKFITWVALLYLMLILICYEFIWIKYSIHIVHKRSTFLH